MGKSTITKSVYCLVDSEGRWRYIGASVDPKRRAQQHGWTDDVLILEGQSQDWSRLERDWIKVAAELGEPLTNVRSYPGRDKRAKPIWSEPPHPLCRPFQISEMEIRLALARRKGWSTVPQLEAKLEEFRIAP